MRKRLEVCRSQLSRVVLVALVAGVAAGCSSGSVRLSTENLFAGSTADRQPDAIESSDLAPLDGSGDTAGARQRAPITTPASLRQRGWTVENAPVVQVTAGDTAASLSQGFGVPVSVILEANGLDRQDQVRTGQRLVIPTYVYDDDPSGDTRRASADDGGTAGTGAPPTSLDQQKREGRHVVQAGETIDSIARMHRVSPAAVARLNNMSTDTRLTAGQQLRIPAPSIMRAEEPDAPAAQEKQVAAVSTEQQTGTSATDAAQAEPQTDEPRETQVARRPPQDAAEPGSGGAPSAGASGFRWPVRGRIIAGFGKQPDGARNDGINLAVPAGTPVHAAEAGKVIYAGNELEGYGNLVLIQHQDDWVSAYAHNEALEVKRGDEVKRGQRIARVGATGAVDAPQLHFELRKKSKPVDPLPHLAGA